MEEQDPYLGLILDGRYRIDAAIGHGGMGSVYRAIHLGLGEPLAVKFLLREVAAVPSLRERFRREAVALARLRHPGVVSVLDFGEHGDDLYMVMELLQGSTLAELIDEYVLPVVRIANIFDHILQVLEVLHADSIVHRDLKPDNIMVLDTADGSDLIKLFDFGLVFLPTSGEVRLTETGSVRGTPVYMSPEQCRGHDVGPASDIYSLGVTLYEVLSGRPPFVAADAASVMAQHMFVEPPVMSRDQTLVPPALQALVRHAMEKDPERRPSAREMRSELMNVVRGTDAISIAEDAAKARARDAVRSRSERAPTAAANVTVAIEHSGALAADVRLWITDGERAGEIATALAMGGINATMAYELLELQVADAVVLAGEDSLEWLSRFRQEGISAPILVVDVGDNPASYARAGASDIAMAGSSDGKLHLKVRRLVRRGR